MSGAIYDEVREARLDPVSVYTNVARFNTQKKCSKNNSCRGSSQGHGRFEEKLNVWGPATNTLAFTVIHAATIRFELS